MEALSKIQLLVWSKPLPPYNTFIGGVGEDYPTASALSTAMSLPPEAIQRFTIDNQNNISCRIDRNYYLVNGAFFGKKVKGYFIDLDGRMTSSASGAFADIAGMNFRCEGLTSYPQTFNRGGSPRIAFFPNITENLGNSFMSWNNGTDRLYMPLNISISGSSFQSFNTKPLIGRKNVIYINSAVATNAMLLYAQSQGATLRQVTNFDTPNKVTNLSVAEVKSRIAKLNFTTPTAGTNPIDFYEVWYEKVEIYRDERKYLPSNSEIKASNEYVTFLEPETNYKVYVCTVDEMYNGSGMFKDAIKRANSNIIEFTTTALSGYQIGMSAYLKLATNSFDFNGINQTKDTSLTYSGGYANFTNGYVDVADNDALSFTDGTNDISAHVAFGFIWNSKTGTQIFIDKRETGTNGKEWIVYSDGTNIAIMFYNPTNPSSYIRITHPISGISTGVLHTIQFSYDGSKLATGIKCYLNGVSVGTTSSAGTYTGMVNGISKVRIGADSTTTGSNYLKADMKELAIWKNRTMSPTEITEIDYKIKNNIPLI